MVDEPGSKRTVPSFVRCDYSEIFSLSFGAFSYATRDPALEFVWAANTAVPVLQLHGQADRITNSVSAP